MVWWRVHWFLLTCQRSKLPLSSGRLSSVPMGVSERAHVLSFSWSLRHPRELNFHFKDVSPKRQSKPNTHHDVNKSKGDHRLNYKDC